jgi:hypothetical protein
VSDDAIPHGVKGYRDPYNCRCDVCKSGWAEYIRGRRAERKAKGGNATDDLARRRAQKRAPTKKAAGQSESSDSVVGPMEAAVVAECASLETPPNATQLVAAKSLASLIDKLNANGDGVGAAVINSSTKQLMSIMAEMRGDTTKSRATGRRKSGGRLATVGALTKVKRQGA